MSRAHDLPHEYTANFKVDFELYRDSYTESSLACQWARPALWQLAYCGRCNASRVHRLATISKGYCAKTMHVSIITMASLHMQQPHIMLMVQKVHTAH